MFLKGRTVAQDIQTMWISTWRLLEKDQTSSRNAFQATATLWWLSTRNLQRFIRRWRQSYRNSSFYRAQQTWDCVYCPCFPGNLFFFFYLSTTMTASSLKTWNFGLYCLVTFKFFFQYFTTKPYACDPSTLPVYSPSKEIDAKHREETTRSEFHTLLSFILLYLWSEEKYSRNTQLGSFLIIYLFLNTFG